MSDFWGFGIIWVVLSALADWVASIVGRHFYVFTASVQAQEGQAASTFVLMTVVPIFVFVVMMLFYALIRFRRRRGDTGNATSQVKFNKAYVSIWVTLSLVINLFLFVHPTASAMQVYWQEGQAYNKNKNELVVDVTAMQWGWMFSYPQYGINESVNANGNDVLYLPVDRPVKFVLNSFGTGDGLSEQIDVIHSFWIPAFGMKTDVVPGETRYEYIMPTKISSTEQNGMMRVQCAEVCGPGHPYMESNLHVVSQADFASWVQQQLKLQNG
ncbi:cytochrome c oxidase subunit II [Alicyclobacillus mengziensis]|uniref:cytochrome-c oxidase n=1 Tax=Alicyclobacillus mengziensis TaxID=2931921 RepID=A0A9X7VXU8_9BACL|nr:cytochrome c oxidase subunit II [Alicyclobacillus mengziensis]QSO46852.1 cytochrome c oxidase subunit II [Alicyclobacillus mengziensis]